MASKAPKSMNPITVKPQQKLRSVSEQEFRANAVHFMRDADAGIQTAILAEDGSVRTVVGLNGIRYLPDPNPDFLDELIQLALDTPTEAKK